MRLSAFVLVLVSFKPVATQQIFCDHLTGLSHCCPFIADGTAAQLLPLCMCIFRVLTSFTIQRYRVQTHTMLYVHTNVACYLISLFVAITLKGAEVGGIVKAGDSVCVCVCVHMCPVHSTSCAPHHHSSNARALLPFLLVHMYVFVCACHRPRVPAASASAANLSFLVCISFIVIIIIFFFLC